MVSMWNVENPTKYELLNPSNKGYGHQIHENMGLDVNFESYLRQIYDLYDRA